MKEIQKKEKELWTNELTQEFTKPKKRVADHDLVAINEIKKSSNYEIIFDLANKTEMMSGINTLRSLVASNKIIINPKCKNTIFHFKNGRWVNNTKEKFARGSDGSHNDAVAAASYLIRAIDFRTNPYPANYGREISIADRYDYQRPTPTHSKPMTEEKVNVYKKLLNLKRKTNGFI